MPSIDYFAYGSNLHPARLRQRVPAVATCGTAVLRGWQLRFNKRGRDGSAKCNIVWTGLDSDAVHGVIYGLARADKAKLDEIEGLGQGYDELRLPLTGTHEISLYVAAATAVDDLLAPFDWYRAFVVEGARFHGLPEAYVAALAAVRAIADPDLERARTNRAILAGSLAGLFPAG